MNVFYVIENYHSDKLTHIVKTLLPNAIKTLPIIYQNKTKVAGERSKFRVQL